jgi:DNA mismatch repair protein MutL
MASRIKLLPENLINRIAAGEVVERPASILKELLENSLDADATRIEVDIESGGKKLIRVADNGCGLNREELFLCLERHATSKLSAESDLFSINTLGFRGEALPSIASVSRMIITSQPENEPGHRLKVEGGRIVDLSPAPTNQGTIIEVKDIFFNVPARRKFLKTEATETAHLIEVAQRYALSRPNLRLRFKDADKEILSVDEHNDLSSRALKILGREVASSLRPIKAEKEDLKIEGYLAGPETARTNSNLFVFVLGRPVRDKLLNRAIIQGYGRTLTQGRYPAGVIFIELDPARVDVNVHPAKTEVRFREPGIIFDTLSKAITMAVDVSPVAFQGLNNSKQSPWSAPSVGTSSKSNPPISIHLFPSPPGSNHSDGLGEEIGDAPKPTLLADDELQCNQLSLDIPRSKIGLDHLSREPKRIKNQNEGWESRRLFGPPTTTEQDEEREKRWLGPYFSMGRPSKGQKDELALPRPSPPWMVGGDGSKIEKSDPGSQDTTSEGRPETEETSEHDQSVLSPYLEGSLSTIRPLAQLHRSYILAQGPRALYIIDQHAAHERILFNSMKETLKKNGLPSQSLLLPETLELGPQEIIATERLLDHLKRLGFQLEPFGGSTWTLRGIPSLLDLKGAKEALIEILAAAKKNLRELDGAGLTTIIENLSGSWLYSLACRAAIKAGQQLAMEEMESLLHSLAEFGSGGFCPHGRPSAIVLSLDELEKRFGRS